MQVIDNFELSAKKSLDSRQNWESLESLKSNTDILMPQGFLAYCKNEDKWYKMNCTDESNPTTYTWSEFNNKDNLSLETLNDVNIDDTVTGDFVALVKKDTDWTNENLEIQEYTKEELLEKIGLTTEDVDIITGLLTDSSVVSTTKTWNSSAIYTELKNTKEECKDYALGLLGNVDELNSEKVKYSNDLLSDVTNVKQALDGILAKLYYVKPSINSFTASANGGVFEVGTTITAPITFNWEYNKNITTQSLTDCTLADEIIRTATYNSDITTDKTFTLTASDGENTVSKSISYKFVAPYYIGVSTTNTLTETEITALTKKLEAKGTKTVNYTTNQSYMVFAYPKSYGAINSIIDQNGFNVTDSFIQNTLTINSVEYYVYISNQCTGIYTMKFNY